MEKPNLLTFLEMDNMGKTASKTVQQCKDEIPRLYSRALDASIKEDYFCIMECYCKIRWISIYLYRMINDYYIESEIKTQLETTYKYAYDMEVLLYNLYHEHIFKPDSSIAQLTATYAKEEEEIFSII